MWRWIDVQRFCMNLERNLQIDIIQPSTDPSKTEMWCLRSYTSNSARHCCVFREMFKIDVNVQISKIVPIIGVFSKAGSCFVYKIKSHKSVRTNLLIDPNFLKLGSLFVLWIVQTSAGYENIHFLLNYVKFFFSTFGLW